MRLLKLTLTNFKGCRAFTFEPNGRNASVFGDNGTGKTTVEDAFLWLLFGKDSLGRSDFELKTLDKDNNPIHYLDHEVEGAFSIGGKTLTLRKVYAEKYTKKRGSATAEFTGHETNYFVDGVPVKKGEYEAKIASIVDEGVFKLLTSPTFFNEQLHWQKRREILLEVCGDISDDDVIASDKALAKLPDILQGRKLEDHRKVIAARRAEINKELDKLPVRIDEATRALPDVTGINAEEITGEIDGMKSQVQEKRQELARLQSGGEVAEKTKALRLLEGNLLQIKNEHRAKVDEAVQGKKMERGILQDRIVNLPRAIMSKQEDIKAVSLLISDRNERIAKLREAWHSIDAEQFAFEQDSVCPTCGQDLPEERLTEAREKAEAEFKLKKAERLEEITAMGKQFKAEVERLQNENATLAKEVADLQAELAAAESEVVALNFEITSALEGAADVTDIPAYIQAVKEAESLKAQIAELGRDNAGMIAAVREEIGTLESTIGAFERTLAQVEQHRQGQERIAELKRQEKALAAEFERLEGELYLCDQFTKRKVELLDHKINSRFKLARFKLFDVQINGGIEPCCETLYDGVPYGGGLNNAARINVGLDIINTLSEHYGFAPPVFIDNAEAVVELLPTKGQMIKLVVSGADKVLRVEHENILREVV